MPQMGTSVVEGTVVAWSAEVGQPIAADQVVCEISTDKIDSEVPALASGTLAEIVVQVGETVDVGTVLGRIATTETNPASGIETEQADSLTKGNSARPTGALLESAGVDGPARSRIAPGRSRPRRYSPVVQRVAAQHDVDLSQVTGTGHNGRVTKKDVLAHIESSGNGAGPPEERPLHIESPYRQDWEPTAESPDLVPDVVAGSRANGVLDGGVAEPLSRMRQSIGAAMTHSLQTAATCTTIVECDMSWIERRRRELGLTALPLVARCAVETLREFPDLNATLDGVTITRYESVHLGIAVSLGADGLIVPVIRDAQELSPEGIAARIVDLASRARAKGLSPDEVRGATFTLTNPGQFGALIATPVIATPQVAILDIEAVVKRPIVIAHADGTDAIAIRPMVNLCMSWDHRALDGAYAAQFLNALRGRIEV
jgi:pyruvate/2-oxoglutarate dehydrogenase complex dihydrolipoamide acyltransferase (E2) component